MIMKKAAALCLAMTAVLFGTFSASGESASGRSVNIKIDTQKDRKQISPYIYGVNAELMEKDVRPGYVRAGGNRYTAYNWETNASNAGSDNKNISDGYFVRKEYKDIPGSAALHLSDVCKQKNAYPLMTLQLAGYVSADTDGAVTKDQKAPSQRWNKAELVKGSDFTLSPDLNDGTVYMDEFVNYLFVNACLSLAPVNRHF